MTHRIDVRSKSNSENEYRLPFTGGVEARSGIGGRDHITDGGTTAVGRVVSGVDSWEYWGQQGDLKATDPDDLQLRINKGDWNAASAYGATRMGGGGGGSSGGSGGSSSGGSGGGDGGGTSKDASGEWNPQTGGDRDLDPKHGVANRPYQSERDRTVVVGSGGDVGTVQEALNMVPRFLEHQFHIKLQQGVHANEPGDSLNGAPTVVASAHGSFKIIGDTDNPRDYAIDVRQANLMFLAGTAQNVALEGIHLRGSLQNRFGALEVDASVISAGQRWGKGGNVPIDTYGGHLQILDGAVLEGDDAAMNFVENASISLSGDVVVDVDGALCTSGQHGGELSLSGGADISCSGLTAKNWDQSIVTIKDPHGATDGLADGSRADVRR